MLYLSSFLCSIPSPSLQALIQPLLHRVNEETKAKEKGLASLRSHGGSWSVTDEELGLPTPNP